MALYLAASKKYEMSCTSVLLTFKVYLFNEGSPLVPTIVRLFFIRAHRLQNNKLSNFLLSLLFLQLRKIIQTPDFPSKRNLHLRTKPLEQRRQELEDYIQVTAGDFGRKRSSSFNNVSQSRQLYRPVLYKS